MSESTTDGGAEDERQLSLREVFHVINRDIKEIRTTQNLLVDKLNGNELLGERGVLSYIREDHAIIERLRPRVDGLEEREKKRFNIAYGGWKTLCLIGAGIGGLLTILYNVVKDYIIPHKP